MALFGKRGKAYEVWGDKPRWKEARQRLKDAGIKVDIDENGSTFEENALIKANALRPYTDGIILADDSGLEVDYLNKEPGVHSARYMGEDTSYDIKNQSSGRE